MSASGTTYPRISIVIPSFNQGEFIEQTLASIIGQRYPNLELIVIDGGSSDRTAEIIAKYADAISYYVSEPDNGQGHAINKGFRIATGDILAWINSDDMYLPCTFAKIARIIRIPSAPMLVYGGSILFDDRGQFAQGRLPCEFERERLTYFDYIEQASTFWSRSLWESVGELNEAYHYVLDWDWFLRASRICNFTPLREHLSLYRLHPMHKTGSGGEHRQREIVRLIEQYARPDWVTAYHEVAANMPQCKQQFQRYSQRRLIWLHYLAYLPLYLKHGRHRLINVIFPML